MRPGSARRRGQASYRRLWGGLLVVAAILLAGCGADQDRVEVSPTPRAPDPTATPSPPPLPEFAEYELDITLDQAGQRVTGQQVVTVPNHTTDTWFEIVFRLYPNLPQYGGQMQVGQVLVDGQPASSTLRAGDTALAVALPAPLAPGKAARIQLEYQIAMPVVEAGYVLFGQSQGMWSLPDAYALLAAYDRGVWREDLAPDHGDAVFAQAAMYDVSLTLPPELVLVSTGVLVDQTTAAGGERVYHLQGGPLREMAWLASAGYGLMEGASGDTVVRSIHLVGDEASGEAALNAAVAALRVYEEWFGDYPYPTLDVVEAPLMHYGMEYSGLIMVGLDLYRAQRAQLEDRVVHEVAHQWWYAQVGNDQVNVPWLDEGLAEFSMAIYYVRAEGEAQANTLVNQRWLVPYQVAIDNGYDRVVNQPSAAFAWEYEVIVYAKAALFFDALRQELGDELLMTVLRAYVEQYRWQVAHPEDFLAVAESVSGRDLDDLYTRWILTAQ